jgi:DNA-binding NarL/FixJ family response regulator
MRRNRLPTERELQILRLVAAGYEYAEVGDQLFITESTVQTCMGRIMMKLDAYSRQQAIAEALHRNLITLSEIPRIKSVIVT